VNARQRRTLAALFEMPIRRDIRWADFESLVNALGGTVTSGSGSHRRIVLKGTKFNTVKPHPDAILKVYQVKQFRENLKSLKITPK
jgi:hypothetical protein